MVAGKGRTTWPQCKEKLKAAEKIVCISIFRVMDLSGSSGNGKKRPNVRCTAKEKSKRGGILLDVKNKRRMESR